MRGLYIFMFICTSFSVASAESMVKLNWEYKQSPVKKYTCNYFADDPCDGGIVKIVKAQSIRDRIQFEAIIHNNQKDWYQCFHMTTNDKYIHIDDELGNEYKGLKLQFKENQDNKLALNQRKKIKFSIPKPKEDVSLVNIHLGFFFNNVKSGSACSQPIGSYGINFHKLDWDISELMGG